MKHHKNGSERWLGKKEDRDRDLVLLWMNWFSVYLNFHPGVNFCSFLHLINISQCCCLSVSQAFTPSSNSHASPFFSFLNLFLSLAFSLFVTPFFSLLWVVCILNLVSQTSLKARSSKEKFDISFHPIVSRLQRSALWLVDSQLIKPLVVWHPVLSSGRVTLLNEIN